MLTKPMPFRCPDNPIRHFRELLEQADKEPGTWIGQIKRNGWRRPGYKQGIWTFHSKYETGVEAKSQPPADLVAELDTLNIPDGTAFDMEWMGNRDTEFTGGRHWFEVFDLLYYQGQWQGDIPYEQRLANLVTLLELHFAKAKVKTPRIVVCKSVRSGFVELFERLEREYEAGQRGSDGVISEGLVMKLAGSTLRGDFNRAKENPGWFKVKYRD
jgi:hypothetical protein